MKLRAPLVALAVLTFLPACNRKIDNHVHVDAIRAELEAAPDWVEPTALGARLWAIERGFYESRGYEPAWVDGDRTTPRMKDLVQQFKYSERHGLDPARYPIEEFERLRDQSQTRMGTRFAIAAVPELDLKLTYGYLRYAADLIGWNSSSAEISRTWLTVPKKEDLAARLAEAIASNSIRTS